jgi:pumilio RNA-binding family
MLTLSQYGQKAIMSALKSRDQHFVTQYVDILCDRDGSLPSTPNGGNSQGSPTTTNNVSPASNTANTNSRQSILVDISSAPQGVQIVTQLLTSVQPMQRDRIIKTVRKNSVFLKGSKAGLRVHQLCERARAFTGY